MEVPVLVKEKKEVKRVGTVNRAFPSLNAVSSNTRHTDQAMEKKTMV
jgi:hypothetical protein